MFWRSPCPHTATTACGCTAALPSSPCGCGVTAAWQRCVRFPSPVSVAVSLPSWPVCTSGKLLWQLFMKSVTLRKVSIKSNVTVSCHRCVMPCLQVFHSWPVWGHCGWVWLTSSSLRSAHLWLAVAVAYTWCSPKSDETQGEIGGSLSNCFSLSYKTWINGIPEWIFCCLKLCWNNHETFKEEDYMLLNRFLFNNLLYLFLIHLNVINSA